jgi:hypothetical protein
MSVGLSKGKYIFKGDVMFTENVQRFAVAIRNRDPLKDEEVWNLLSGTWRPPLSATQQELILLLKT